MSLRACVLIANGTEEVEAVTPIDYLRRAGIETVVAGIGEIDVVGSHDLKLTADIPVDELEGEFDCVVVPGGGKGAENIASDPSAVSLVKRQFEAGRLVAAICAAPVVVLDRACGILKGKSFTCYPGMEEKVQGADFLPERVVVDGTLITARAAGCAGEFAYAIIEAMAGESMANEVAEKVLL